MQYVIVFWALGGPKCNTSLCLGPWGALTPGGPKMQYLTVFGALRGPKCNTSQCLGPWGPTSAMPHSVWAPWGPQNAMPHSVWGPWGPQNAIRHSVFGFPYRGASPSWVRAYPPLAFRTSVGVGGALPYT